jgi:GTP-binding protein
VFIDHVIVDVRAGDGGDGCVSFRHEKFAAQGGPNGGNGGRGGDITLVASCHLTTLVDLQYKRHFKAGRGEHGRGKSQSGAAGADVTIQVPVGTVVHDADTKERIGELTEDGEQLIVAKGGRYGLGNENFKTPSNRTPRQFTYGGDGEVRRLEITLKLIADVGLVGEPNAGKSTLISVVSAAHPKIADYPFTTTTPVHRACRRRKILRDGGHPGSYRGRAPRTRHGKRISAPRGALPRAPLLDRRDESRSGGELPHAAQ